MRSFGVGLGLVLLTLTHATAQDLLTLSEAVGLALENNYGIQAVRNEVDIAENDVSLGNARYWPRLSFSAGSNGTLSNTRQSFIGDQGTIDRDRALTNRYNAGLQLAWTLFEGGGRSATYRRLGALQVQQEALAEREVEATLADVMILYYNIVRQKEQLRVFEEAVGISQERVRIAELRRDLGSASELEVRQAQVDLNTDSAGVIRQRQEVANAKVNLNQLVGRPALTPFEVVDAIEVDTTLTREALVAVAQAESPDLELAESARRAAELTYREVRAERLPALDLSVGYGYSYLDSESGFLNSSRAFDFTFGVAASYNLFDGFNLRRRLENARLRIRNADLALQDTRTLLEANLVTLFNAYESSLDLVALEESNLDAARLNVEIAIERFELGTITSVELREVQETLISAESRLILAKFEAKQAEVDMLRLSGQLVNGD